MKEHINLAVYALKNALLGMVRHWALCLGSITTVFLSLILVAVFVILGFHVDAFSSSIAQDLSIHVILEPEIESEEEIAEIFQKILEVPNVKEAHFSSKENELELMIEEKGEAFSLYREDNPLSNAFFVYVEDESRIEQTYRDLNFVTGVQSAAYGGTSVKEMVQVLTTIRYFALGFTGLLMILALYLIYNTIRASIYSRQNEISIMRTVGATSSFIRVPFEIEGVLIGLLGAVIPYALIYFGYSALYTAVDGYFFIRTFSLIAPSVINREMAWILFGLGGLTGWIASWSAAWKYLRGTR